MISNEIATVNIASQGSFLIQSSFRMKNIIVSFDNSVNLDSFISLTQGATLMFEVNMLNLLLMMIL